MSYIGEFKNKDLKNFDKFYESTRKSVFYAIYLIVKSVDVTEDLLQETYIAFLENVKKIGDNIEPAAWLVKTAKNKAINYFNKMKYEREYLEKLQNYSYSKDKYIDTGLLKTIKEVLNDKEFEVFVMHVLGEYSFKEIAEITKIPIGTLTWMYQESRKKLEKVIGGEK